MSSIRSLCPLIPSKTQTPCHLHCGPRRNLAASTCSIRTWSSLQQSLDCNGKFYCLFSDYRKQGDSTLDNVEEWRWRLTMLMRNKSEQEVVSRDKKDRRDLEQLSTLAIGMGLHSGRYEKIVVFSKLPLPNYRSDLDEKRPQREVMLPIGLQKRVESHLRAHLSRKAMTTSSAAHSLSLDGLYEPEESSTQNVIAETIVRRRSLQMHNKQQDWKVSVSQM